MDNVFYKAIEDSPVIAAVKDMEGLEKCLQSELKIVFVLFGDVCNIPMIVQKIKMANKIAMVHIDLIAGLNAKEISVDFIKNNTAADGIISTKMNIIKRAKELAMYTVYRVFVIDSMALLGIEHQKQIIKADLIEILPGIMPKIIKRICKISSRPVIAGGLVMDKSDVIEALEAGAISISTTNQKVWFM